MKKALLLFVIVSSYLNFATAQKSVLLSDSAYFSPEDKIALHPHVWTKGLYNSNCLDSITQVNFPDDPSESYQNIYTYYPDNSLYQQLYQTYDTISSAFINSTRITYTYNPSKTKSSLTKEKWNGTTWQPQGLGSYTYDAEGRTTTYIDQVWDPVQQVYINSSETVYGYDESGRNIHFLSAYWDEDSGTWQPSFGYDFIYDELGNQVYYSASQQDFLMNTYQPFSELYNYFNNDRLIDSSYRVEDYGFFTDSVRSYYSYHPFSSAVNQTTIYHYNDNGSFREGSIENHFYDTVGTTYIDSTIAQTFNEKPDDLYPGGNITVKFSDTTTYTITDSTITKTFSATPDNTSRNTTYLTRSDYNEFHQQTRFFLNYTDTALHTFNFREDNLQYTLCSSILPVTLLNFTGTQKNGNAQLQWQTLNEINTSNFAVQRSVNGVDFTTIGKVSARGNSSSRMNYAYTDANINQLNTKELYYRLAAQDKDGKITYSNTIELSISNGKLSVSISPNPVQNVISLHSPVSMPNATINITDVNGAVLYVYQKNIVAGDAISIDASRLPKGMYLVTIQSQKDKQVLKFVK